MRRAREALDDVADPATFAKNIERRAAEVITRTQQVKTLATGRALGSLVRNTPVDTGNARSNWVVAIGKADLADRPVRSAEFVITEGQSIANRAGFEDDIHIANGGDKVPYLAGLNDGDSQQAPRGFLRGAVVEALALIQGWRLLT